MYAEKITRRDFLKKLGLTTAVAAETAAFSDLLYINFCDMPQINRRRVQLETAKPGIEKEIALSKHYKDIQKVDKRINMAIAKYLIGATLFRQILK